jgi:uncharacterized membrane protein YfcA
LEELLLRAVAFVLVGLASGFLSGLFGIGGGIVRVPIFLYLLPLFGVAHSLVMHVSVGTSMALIIPSAVAASRKQIRLGNLDLKFFRIWAVGVFVGALIGSVLLPHISTDILMAIFALYLLVVGIYEGFAKGHVMAKAMPHTAADLGVASAIGCVATLTGTAGGTLTTPVLQAFGVALKSAVAIGSATGLVTGSMGSIGAIVAGWHARGLPPYSLGYIDGVIFVAMLPAIMFSAPIGIRTQRLLSETWLRRAYTVMLFVSATDLLLKLMRP